MIKAPNSALGGCALALLSLLGAAWPTAADEIPATLRPNWSILSFYPEGIPIWVSAKQAFDEEGKLIPSLFRPEELRRIQELLQLPKDPKTGCSKVLWIEQDYVNPPDRHSPEAALASSEVAIWGKVVSSDFGFERGDLGQMMMIQPIEQLKPRGRAELRNYFIFVPAGRLRFAGYDICKEDPKMVVPEVGDEVVLFPKEALPGEAYLNLEYDGSIIVFPADGGVRWPSVMDKFFAVHSGEFESKSSVLDSLRATDQEQMK